MIIRIKAHPKSKEEKIIRKGDDRFEVFVRAKSENGLANESILKALSKELSCDLHKMRIVRGSSTPNKIIEIS